MPETIKFQIMPLELDVSKFKCRYFVDCLLCPDTDRNRVMFGQGICYHPGNETDWYRTTVADNPGEDWHLYAKIYWLYEDVK